MIYIKRKISKGQTPKDRLEWKQASEYWTKESPVARGNNFNKTVREADIYDYHEIFLENGKRLDSYDPDAGEIISRKATDLDKISEETYRRYLSEFSSKYSEGTKIRSNAYLELDGQELRGQYILEMQDISIIGIIVAVVVLVILLFMAIGYVKAPPDMAYIISGVKKKSKVVIGKASIRIPFFERLDKLNLRLIPIDVKTSNAVPTADYININVDATVNVKISNNPEKLRLAAENFLNKNTEYIAGVAREVLEGNVREIVGKMKLEEMVSDRQKFANLVKENAEPDLAAMGLDIISFNVQNFVDGNEVIENLGIDNIVKIKKAAAIARAESERDIKVAQASADKESNDAAVAAQTEIAKKQNELAIKKSELQMEADTKKAMADAAYDIQKEEQRKTIEVATANADIAKQEREIELKQKEVAVTEQSLEAEVKKKAEANKYAAQQQAEAQLYQRQKEAEARQFEAQRQAEAQKAEAEAMRYAKEQEAAGIRAVGEAEASAIQAKGIAEAEAMEKKAEAYAKYNKAAVAEMMIKVLPDIAAKVAEPLGQIDKITIIGGGDGENGVGKVAGNVPVVMAKVFESMKEATGIDLSEIINADSYDAKVNRNVNVTGLDGVNLVVNADTDKNGEKTEN